MATVAKINATPGGITIDVIPRVRIVRERVAGGSYLSFVGLATYLNDQTFAVRTTLLDEYVNLKLQYEEYEKTVFQPQWNAWKAAHDAHKKDRKNKPKPVA